MGSFGWENVLSVPAYLAVIALTCLTTATIALFCSVLFRKTATSMMTSYMIIGALFCLPLALRFFAGTYFPRAAATAWIDRSALTSPIAATFGIPLNFQSPTPAARIDSWNMFFSYVAFTSALDLILLGAIIWLFNTRWRVAE
jgi:hypothetical protein